MLLGGGVGMRRGQENSSANYFAVMLTEHLFAVAKLAIWYFATVGFKRDGTHFHALKLGAVASRDSHRWFQCIL